MNNAYTNTSIFHLNLIFLIERPGMELITTDIVKMHEVETFYTPLHVYYRFSLPE